LNIYIDESGNFAHASSAGSWNVVAAVSAAETARKAITDAVRLVRKAAGAGPTDEVKLNQLDERAYALFLSALDRPDIILFATATDSHLNGLQTVRRHQDRQVQNIRDALPRMRYEGGRQGVALLANQVESLSPQLYVQLVCQVDLLHDLIQRSINYFAQRRPSTLREFRWRIDQKNVDKPTFEEAFEKIAPALLQTRSIREPFTWVRGFDYRHMRSYEFEDGKAPDYLQTDYRLPPMDAFDVQKLIRGNIAFVDSKSVDGIQAADLIARGLRRVLREQFDDVKSIAQLMGRLMMQNRRGRNPISLVTFSSTEDVPGPHIETVIKCMSEASKRMLAHGT
jgi:hypothetical protein